MSLEDIEDTDPFSQEFPHLPDDIEYEEEPLDPAVIVRDAAMAASRLYPGSQVIDPLGLRPIDEANDWSDLAAAGPTYNQVDQFLRTYKRLPSVESTKEQHCIDYTTMSPAQQEIIEICRRQMNDPNNTIKRVVVQGKAGTGKSAVIKATCQMLDSEQVSTNKLYQVLAPTGAAAVNIDGKTIHSFLKIPINGVCTPLNGPSLKTFQLQFKDVRFIIIDEYSMIGMRFLHKIHDRLCEAKGSAVEPFGGYFIYLFGDLRQLPPVRDIAIYLKPIETDSYALFSNGLINSIQEKIILTVCHRQTQDQHQFKQVLDSVASGTVTPQGWQLLMTRRIAIVSENHFTNAIHLFPTNEKVNEHNTRIMSENRLAVAIIEAMHNNATARQSPDNLADGLSRRPYLSVGCRIMLRKNLCVEKGLVNGSLGTVKAIVYHSGERPPALP